MSDVITYSFSRISMYKTCPHSYFKRYILKEKGDDSIFTLAGTSTHNAVENIQEGKLTNDEALREWMDEMEFHSILGYEFVSEKTEKNFKESIKHYIKNFKKIDGDVEVEKEITVDINGYRLKGFIDFLVKKGNHVEIYDLKTSTIYKQKDLEHYKHQLIIYALAMQSLGYVVDKIGWIFMKYATINGKRKEKHILRNELIDENYKDCIIFYELTEETIQDTIDWVTDTIKEIESKDDLFDEWEQNQEKFYCTKLCCFKNECPCALELRDNYFRNK